MAKATIKLNNGTLVTIEGTVQEIEALLQIYGGGPEKEKLQIPKRSTKPKNEPNTLPDSASEESTFDMMKIINLVKTCDEAEAIEKQILDRTSEVNRVLLPLYVIHEYLKNAFGLSTTEIANITTELGIRVSRQNALRVFKYSGARYVIGDKPRKVGSPTWPAPPKTSPTFELGLVKGDRQKWQGNISRANRSSASCEKRRC